MFEYVGNIHMHTPYSDGAKWHSEIASDAIAAGLDFIIVTDHNIWVDGIEGYYETEQGRVFVLVGEEVHDPRRPPQANHFLAYGAEKELASYADNPQKLINETIAAGGYGFLAHPFDPAAPTIGEGSLAWQEWQIDGYTGLEIWNYMSNFKALLGHKIRTAQVALNPAKYITGPDLATLAKWDELLSTGQRVAAIGSSDAHGQTYRMGPLSRVIFPYEFLFRSINTHLLTHAELSGNVTDDKKMILKALGQGNSWVGYDLPHRTTGFRFSGQSKTRGIMGDEIRLDVGATLQVVSPTKCHIRILHQGNVVAKAEREVSLTHLPVEAGAYRAECYLPYLGQERGWIFSNPIYLI